MASDRVPIGEALSFGWSTTKSNFGFLVAVLIVAILVGALPEALSESVFMDLVSFALSSAMTMGVIRISLRFCDGKRPAFGDLFSCFPLLPQYIIASIIFGLIVGTGLILLIIPGIIWSIQFFFYDFEIVDREVGPFASLGQSSAITKGAKWDLLLFFLSLAGINVLGALLLGVGLLATIPTTMVALAFVYRRLEATATPA